MVDGEGVGGKCSSRLEWTLDVWEILRPPRIGQGSAIRGRLEAVRAGWVVHLKDGFQKEK